MYAQFALTVVLGGLFQHGATSLYYTILFLSFMYEGIRIRREKKIITHIIQREKALLCVLHINQSNEVLKSKRNKF